MVDDSREVSPIWKTQPQVERHPRGCTCGPCIGRRNRRSGLRKQRMARKALGVPSGRFATLNSNEENWRARFRVEVKSGLQVKAMATRYLEAERQSDQNKASGDPRPFMFVAMPQDWGSEGLMVMRLSSFVAAFGDLSLPEDNA